MINDKKRERRAKRGNDLRVFILGAGVSAACGVPVAKDLLRDCMGETSGTPKSEIEKVHKLLKYLYPAFSPKLRNYPNIEDVFNLIEMAKTFNSEEFLKSDQWSKPRLNGVQRVIEKIVTDFLWSLMQNRERFSTIREFAAENVTYGDVIITFNWDVTIESALHLHPDEPEFEYFYPSRSRKVDMYLLKPHGSIDWFRQSPASTIDPQRRPNQFGRLR